MSRRVGIGSWWHRDYPEILWGRWGTKVDDYGDGFVVRKQTFDEFLAKERAR